MRLPPYPPHDFECAYRHSCPYLDWLSTTWVLEEYRRADEVYQEHLRIIEAFDPALKARDDRVRVLERENAELKAKLRALHQRQFKSNKKKNVPDSEETQSSPGEKKKRGAPVGHPGWSRPQPDHIDRTVEVPAPTVCPHCQSNDLTPLAEIQDHLQEDIVIQPRTRGYPLSAWAGVLCALPPAGGSGGPGRTFKRPYRAGRQVGGHLFTLSDGPPL